MAFLLKYSKQLAADKASEKDINSVDAAMTAVSLWRTAAIVKGLPSVDALAFNMTVPAEADHDADDADDEHDLDDLDDGDGQNGENGDHDTTAKSKKTTKDVVIPADLPGFVRKEWRAVQLPLKQLRNARYSVAAKFLPAPSFWTEWVNDEKALLLLLSELRSAFDEKTSDASHDHDGSSNNNQKQKQQQEEFPLEAALVEQHKRLLEVTLRAADATAGARDSVDFAFALTGLQTGTLAANSTSTNPTTSTSSSIDDHQRQWTPLSLAAKVLSVAGPWPQYRHLAHLHIADLLSEEADRVGAGGDIVTNPIDEDENETNDQNDDDEKNQKIAERTAQKLEQRLRRHYARFFATSTSALPAASHVTLRALSAAITGTTHQQQYAHDHTHTDPTPSTTMTSATTVVTNATIAAAAKKIAQHQSSAFAGAQNLLGFTPAGLDAVQLVNDHFEQWEVDVGSKGAKSVTSAFESATKKLTAVQEASQALLRELRSNMTLAPAAAADTLGASGSGVPATCDDTSLPEVISADPFDLSNQRWPALTAAKSQSAGSKKIGVDVKAAVIEELLVEDPQNVSLWSALIDADAAACPRRTVAVALRALHSVCPLELLSSSVPFASASTAGGSLQDQAGVASTVHDGENSETSKSKENAQRRFNTALSAAAAAAKFWHRIVAVARTYARDAEIRASSKSNNAAAMSLALLSAVEESAAMVSPTTATSAKPAEQVAGATGAGQLEKEPSKIDDTLSVNDLRQKFSAALHDRFDEEVASVALTHPPVQLLTMALRWCVTVASMLRSLAATTTTTATQDSVKTSDEKTQQTQSSSRGIESPLLIGDGIPSSSLSSEGIDAAMSAVAGVATEALWAMAVRCKPSLSGGAGVSSCLGGSGGGLGSGAATTNTGAKTGATSAASASTPAAFSVADEDLTSLNFSEWGFEANAASVVAWATRLFPPVADDVPSLEHVGEIDLDVDLDDEDRGAEKETANEEVKNGAEQSSSSTAASPSKHAVMTAPPLWFAKAALDAARVVSSLRSASDAPPAVMSSSGGAHDGSQRKRALDHDGKHTTSTTPPSTTTEEACWMERQSMIAKSLLSFIAITEHSGRFGLPHAIVAADAIAMRVALDGRAALPGARRAWRNLIRIAQSFHLPSSSFDPKRTQQDHRHIAGEVFSCESSLQRQLLQSNDAIARIGAVWQATEAFAMSPPSAIVEARSAVYKATAAHNSNHVRSAHEDIVAPGKRPRD